MDYQKVVVVGATGIDTNVYLAGRDIDFEVEANFSQNLDYVGGAGGYSSRGFAQLGYPTGYIGYVGDDFNGQFIRDELAHDGIATTLFIDSKGTRRSVNLMYRDGRRKNFYDGRGAMEVRPDLDVCRAALAGARLVHFSIENWCRYLLPLARESGATIACDLQDVISLDDSYRRDFIEAADILFLSAANYPDPAPLIEQFLAAKPSQIIVVGMGERGCALGTAEGIRFFESVAIAEPVVDTNGAGDGLAVGFLSAYCLGGYDLEQSIRRGQIVARYTCTQKGDTSHLITSDQLEHYFL